jgi:predicted RNase H-like nuclease (RuvC/YqgF family)
MGSLFNMAKITANKPSDQYDPGDNPIAPNRMTVKEKMVVDLESMVKNLQAANESNVKIIDKMRKDITRLKDQISELAGKITRG